MDTDGSLFDLDMLKKVIRCAALISSIDGAIHDREWETIQDFGDRNTSTDLAVFYETVLMEISQLLPDEPEMLTRTDTLIEELSAQLNEQQKSVVLQLLEHVLVTGYPRGTEDAGLFCSFLQRLSGSGAGAAIAAG
jgi:hypothetical protein